MALKAELRTSTGTGASKKARNEGKIPVVLYGNELETTSLLINRREFEALLKKEGSNAVFNLDYDGKSQKVILKDFVKASLSDTFYSVDLEAISANQRLTVDVPLTLVNEESVKEGIVELVLNTIKVETTPDSIPNNFEIDVTGMEIGDTRSISDLTVADDVAILDEDTTIVTVSAPTEEPKETDADQEPAEPEVIGEEVSEENAE